MALEIENSLIYLRALKQLPGRQLQAEDRLNRRLQELFQEVERKTLEELLRRNRVPTDDITLSRISNHIRSVEGDYSEAVMSEAHRAAEWGRGNVYDSLGLVLDVQEFSTRVRDLIEGNVFEASRHTINRMVGDVMDNLAQSYEDGLGIDDAADRLRDVFTNIRDYELRRVARTEINSFQNKGAILTEEELGIRYHKWYTAEDERVRSEHVDVHGEIVRVGEPFSNDLIYPGDKAGDIKEWINCRCRLVPFLMPEGKTAPPGMSRFREEDLINIRR